MSDIDTSALIELQRQLYSKVKSVFVTYDKNTNSDLYDAVVQIFGTEIPDNKITLDMVITCLEVVKRGAADKADSVLDRI